MKSITAPLFAVLLALPAHALSLGDQVTPDAISKAEFIKGEPLKEWEADKPYIITCWASGSVPSVATLPMLQDLQNLYGKRGLRIIAINVGENDKEKVVNFMANQGKRITHSVAFVPSGDTFQTEWVDAAKITQLPFAFVVRDGRYIYGAHPANLTGELIEAFLAGGKRQQEALDKLEREKVTESIIDDHLKAYSTAQKANDADAMEKAIASIATTQPDFIHLPRMIVDVALVRKDWSAAAASLKAIADPQLALMSAALISRRYDTAEEQPEAVVYETVASILTENGSDDASVKASLARVQWKLGKKMEALATARLAALKPGDHAKGPFNDFAKSFETDSPQSLEDLILALNKATKPNP